MGKRYSKEERLLLVAGVKFAEENKIPYTKLAWALSGVMDRSDATLYRQMREMQPIIDKIDIGTIKFLQDSFDWGADRKLKEEEEIALEEATDAVHAEDMLEKHVGEVVKVRAIAVRTFGALCTVENTTRTLLLHISEMANEFIEDISSYVEIGDEFYAMLILSAENRLALTTRRIGTLRRKAPRVGRY